MLKIAMFLFAVILAITSTAQTQRFEIFGTIQGQHYSKVYLFFDGNLKQKDSLSSEIKDGKFHFSGSVQMPALARLVLDDQNSFIADVYIDNSKTYVACTNEIKS